MRKSNHVGMVERLDAIEERIMRLEELLLTGKKAPVSQKALSASEYLDGFSWKSDVDLTFLFMVFLETEKSQTSSNVSDITNMFKQAKIPIPRNINDKTYQLVRKGLLMESDKKKDGQKAWTLTRTGLRFVEGMKKNGE